MKMGLGHQKANQEFPGKIYRDTHWQQSQPCHDKNLQEGEDFHIGQVLPKGQPHNSAHIEQQERVSFLAQDPAKVSFSVEQRMSLRYKRRLKASFLKPTHTIPLIPKRRSLFLTRLYLCWLNFALIPTRIAYILRRSLINP